MNPRIKEMLLRQPSQGIVRNGLVALYDFNESANLLKYSEDFSNAVWSKAGCSYVSNKITENSSLSSHGISQSAVFTIGQTYTWSTDLKAGERSKVRFAIYNTGYDKECYINLSNGTVYSVSSGISARVESIGSGVYRCHITFTPTVASLTLYIFMTDNSYLMTYQGDGTSGLYIYQTQLQQFPTAREYIKTTDKQRLFDKAIPEINLLTPNQANACEDGTTTGLVTSSGGVLSVESSVVYQGSKSLKVTTPGSVLLEGMAAVSATIISATNNTFTLQTMLKGSAGAIINVRIYAGGGTYPGNSVTVVCSGDWQLVTKTVEFDSSAYGYTACFKITTYTNIQATIFYLDKIQLQEGSVATDWTMPPNHGQLGSTSGADSNDPTPVGPGLSFGGDDYISIGYINKEMRTMQLVFYNNNIINKDSASQVLVNFSTTGSLRYVSLGSTAGTLTNEIISVRMVNFIAWCDASASIPVGWNLLELRWNGNIYEIILNGDNKPIISLAAINDIINITLLELGRYAAGNTYLSGMQAYLLLYSRSLSDNELKQNRKAIRNDLLKRGVILAA
jgi:hypothetical protein